jgi:hypothetical protein
VTLEEARISEIKIWCARNYVFLVAGLLGGLQDALVSAGMEPITTLGTFRYEIGSYEILIHMAGLSWNKGLADTYTTERRPHVRVRWKDIPLSANRDMRR